MPSDLVQHAIDMLEFVIDWQGHEPAAVHDPVPGRDE
jgi:hypothetical protein